MNLTKNMWYLDKGASSHMTSKRSYFHSFDENQQGVIRFGDESLVRFEGKGSLFLNYLDGEEIKLEGVVFVPSLRVNILSLGKLDKDGFTSTLGGVVLSIFNKEGKNLQEFGRQMAVCTFLNWVSPNSTKFQERKNKRFGCGIIVSIIKISVPLMT